MLLQDMRSRTGLQKASTSAAEAVHNDSVLQAALHPPLDMSLPSTQDSERLYERQGLPLLQQAHCSGRLHRQSCLLNGRASCMCIALTCPASQAGGAHNARAARRHGPAVAAGQSAH